MFHFPLSGLAVCMKTAPVLPRSRSTLSFHLRLPHFSLLLLTCFHLRVATKRKRKKSQVCARGASKTRGERRRKQESVFSFPVVFFLFFFSVCFWIVPPQRSGLLECHSEWTQELWGLSLYFQEKKNLWRTFFFFNQRIHPFLLPLFIILKTCRRWCKEERSEDVGGEEARCFCAIKIPSPRREFKDMHQRRYHVGLFVVYLTLHS